MTNSRTLTLLSLVLAAVGITYWSSSTPVAAPPAHPESGGLDARVDELRATVASLRGELEALRAQVERLTLASEMTSLARDRGRELERVALPRQPEPRVGDSPERERPRDARLDPAELLEQYVESFRDGGQGTEFLRLAVQSFVVELLPRITPLVRNPSTHPLLRQRLVEMLGDARLARDTRAIDLLLSVLRNDDESALLSSALNALAAIGDASTAAQLESLVWFLEAPAIRERALALLVALTADPPNQLLARLLISAPDHAAMTALVDLLAKADPVGALDAFGVASARSQPVRLHAAEAIGGFHADEVLAFIDKWLAVEVDPAVRVALAGARAEASKVPGYSPTQATGPPDVRDPSQDDAHAWTTSRSSMGLQWLELTYARPMRCSSVRIHETSVVGAVTGVLGYDASGMLHELWSGIDPTTQAGIFVVPVQPTSQPLQRLRILLDTNLRSGWKEIDAVELVGLDGSAWAVSATASSYYNE